MHNILQRHRLTLPQYLHKTKNLILLTEPPTDLNYPSSIKYYILIIASKRGVGNLYPTRAGGTVWDQMTKTELTSWPPALDPDSVYKAHSPILNKNLHTREYIRELATIMGSLTRAFRREVISHHKVEFPSTPKLWIRKVSRLNFFQTQDEQLNDATDKKSLATVNYPTLSDVCEIEIDRWSGAAPNLSQQEEAQKGITAKI